MKFMLRLICLSCLVSTLGFSANLAGWLVDARCYDGMVDGRRGTIGSEWDGNLEIRYCSPTRHTRSFTLVEDNWSAFKFDPIGNEKAIALGLNSTNKYVYVVKVTGNTSVRPASLFRNGFSNVA